jgi:hypothetical protein
MLGVFLIDYIVRSAPHGVLMVWADIEVVVELAELQ